MVPIKQFSSIRDGTITLFLEGYFYLLFLLFNWIKVINTPKFIAIRIGNPK